MFIKILLCLTPFIYFDTERDKNEATDDNSIPEELKAQAESYANNFLNPDDNPAGSGQLSQTFRELGRQVRQQMKGEKKL